MGWSSGPILAESLWSQLKELIPIEEHQEAARIIWREFKKHDCDTLDEAEMLTKDARYDWLSNDLGYCKCGKWNCPQEAVGYGVSPINDELTNACHLHRHELSDFKSYEP